MQRTRLTCFGRASIRSAIDRACRILLVLVLGAVVRRYCWKDIEDPFKCGALRDQGTWLDSSSEHDSSHRYRNWQPSGCMMHKYNAKDIDECFAGQKLVFIGDSTTRQIFQAIADRLSSGKRLQHGHERHGEEEKHNDLEIRVGEVTVQFIWDPWLNSTVLDQELRAFQQAPTAEAGDGKSTALLLLGAPGLWYARHGQENHFKDYRDTIDRIIPYMGSGDDEAVFSSMRTFNGRRDLSNLLLMAPVQVPHYDALSPARQSTITPEKVDQMNDYLQQLSAHSKANIAWSFASMTADNGDALDFSGLHVVKDIALARADLLLNLRCNSKSALKGFPHDRTCCMNYKRAGVIQWLVVMSSIILIPVLAHRSLKLALRSTPLSKPSKHFRALSTLLLVLCFCFLADRTQLFEKAQKQVSRIHFSISCTAIGLCGLLSIRKIKPPASKLQRDDLLFLSRDQTDEWKGWMQALILVYHYTAASQSLEIYKLIRLLVSSYLFLTGYGHALAFLRFEDFSLKRVAAVVIRLNLLTVAMSYVMDTNYLFYYFPALATFWFLVVYIVLNVGKSKNDNVLFVFCKILLSLTITTALVNVPGVLECIASSLQSMCRISWDIPEWRFRLSLDLYIVYVGMIAAFVQHRSQCRLESQVLKTHAEQCQAVYTPEICNSSGKFRALLSSIVLCNFFIMVRLCSEKASYNRLHPFISWIPVLCFISLRNSHQLLRQHYSTFFAWLGRISLETYVLQYHIWLAGDTKGLLRLGVFNHGVEVGILTPMFIWLSSRTTDASRNMTNWLVGPEDNTMKTPAPLAEQLSPVRKTMSQLHHGGIKQYKEANDRKSWVSISLTVLRQDLKWRLITATAVLWLVNIIL